MSPDADGPDPVWMVPASGEVIWLDLDVQYAVYQLQSGETHFLNDIGAQALRRLQLSPMTLDELVRQIADAHGLEDLSELRKQVTSLVQRLDGLGLVQVQ